MRAVATPILLAPGNQAVRTPLCVGPVVLGHVLVKGGEAAAPAASGVAGHALTTVKDFQGAAGYAHLQRLAHQRVGHAVSVALELDVIVNVDLDRLEDRQLKGLQQGRHGRVDFMHSVKHLMTQPRHDPALHDLHRGLGLGLVLRVVGARRPRRCSRSAPQSPARCQWPAARSDWPAR